LPDDERDTLLQRGAKKDLPQLKTNPSTKDGKKDKAKKDTVGIISGLHQGLLILR